MCAVDVHVSVLVHLFPLDRNYCYGLVIYDTLVSLQLLFAMIGYNAKCRVNFCARVSCLTNKDLHTVHDYKELVPYYRVDCPLFSPGKFGKMNTANHGREA